MTISTQTRTSLPIFALHHLTAFTYEADHTGDMPVCWGALIGDAMVADLDPEHLSPLGTLTATEDTGSVLSCDKAIRLLDDTLVRQGTGSCFTCMVVRDGRLYFLDGKVAGVYGTTTASEYVVLGHLESI